MQDAVWLMAKPGSKWDTSPIGIKMLPLKCLMPKTNLWVYFIKKQLIPTTHDTTISRDRIMATYYFMHRIPLDVGRIIAAQIISVFSKPWGQFFFPSLIMGLCANAALQSDTFSVDNEPGILINGVVNNKTLRWLMKGSPHQPGLAKAPKGAPKPPTSLLPPPLRPKKKKSVVVEHVTSPECYVDDFNATLPSP